MPFFIADNFTPAAFDAAGQAGIIATTVEQLFGEELAVALRGLVQLLT